MKLKEYLRSRKIRYRSFAEGLGINEQSLKNIVSGTSRPGLFLTLKIEKLTNGQITPQQMVENFEKAKGEKSQKKGLTKKS